MARKTEVAAEDIPAPVQIADQLRPLLHRLTRQLRREAASAGISSLDLLLMGLIKLRPGIGVNELAQLEETTPSTMSAHIRRLRTANWVADDTLSEDLRRSHLRITSDGAEAMAVVRRHSNDWLGQRIQGLSAKDRKALIAALPALGALLRRKQDEACRLEEQAAEAPKRRAQGGSRAPR